MFEKRIIRSGLIVILLLISPTIIACASVPFSYGDVFATISNGKVQHYDSSLNLLETMDSGFTGAYMTGMAFDSSGKLYVTGFNANKVAIFSNIGGGLLGTFGSGYDTNPESILFNSAGEAYVGQADGSRDVLKFNSAGNPLASYNVNTEARGSDWIDLAADQCTLYYTSEGRSIKRYDVCTNSQLSDFATNKLHLHSFALRILPNGEVLVADSTDIHRLDSSGNIIQTYSVPGQNNFFALNLDPDGTSFWSGDYGTSNFYKFDIATGAILMTKNTGTSYYTLFGLAVYGERTQATSSIAGKKINDINGDGDIDVGESGLGGWTIKLSDTQGNLLTTTTTNINGDYTFGSLKAGTYIISEELQAGWSQTAPAGGTYTVTVAGGDNIVDKNFLNTQNQNGIPEFPTVALPIISVLGIMFLMSKRKNN